MLSGYKMVLGLDAMINNTIKSVTLLVQILIPMLKSKGKDNKGSI